MNTSNHRLTKSARRARYQANFDCLFLGATFPRRINLSYEEAVEYAKRHNLEVPKELASTES